MPARSGVYVTRRPVPTSALARVDSDQRVVRHRRRGGRGGGRRAGSRAADPGPRAPRGPEDELAGAAGRGEDRRDRRRRRCPRRRRDGGRGTRRRRGRLPQQGRGAAPVPSSRSTRQRRRQPFLPCRRSPPRPLSGVRGAGAARSRGDAALSVLDAALRRRRSGDDDRARRRHPPAARRRQPGPAARLASRSTPGPDPGRGRRPGQRQRARRRATELRPAASPSWRSRSGGCASRSESTTI